MIYPHFTNLGANRIRHTASGPRFGDQRLNLLSILLNIMNDQFQNELRCVTCSIHKHSVSARRSQRKETPLYDMLDVQLFRLHQRVRNREPLCYSLTHSNHVPILCSVVVVFTRYSTSTFTHCSFVLRSNQALIPSIGLLPSGRIMLYYVPNAQMLFSPILYHTAKRIFWIIQGGPKVGIKYIV